MIPIESEGKVIGVLDIDSARYGEFDECDEK